MSNINVRNIPDEMHREFKSICARRGISMNDMLIQLIQRLVDEEGKR
jgi:plasmid stability protein